MPNARRRGWRRRPGGRRRPGAARIQAKRSCSDPSVGRRSPAHTFGKSRKLIEEPVRHSASQLGVSDPVPAGAGGVLMRVIRETEESHPVPARLNHCGTTRRLDSVARTGCGDSTVCQQSAGVGQRLPLVVESVVVRKRDRPHIDRPNTATAEGGRGRRTVCRGCDGCVPRALRRRTLGCRSSDRARRIASAAHRSTAPPPVLLAGGLLPSGPASRRPAGRCGHVWIIPASAEPLAVQLGVNGFGPATFRPPSCVAVGPLCPRAPAAPERGHSGPIGSISPYQSGTAGLVREPLFCMERSALTGARWSALWDELLERPDQLDRQREDDRCVLVHAHLQQRL